MRRRPERGNLNRLGGVDQSRRERSRAMEMKLAEAIVKACEQRGVRAEVQENYSASWMRGRKTTGVVTNGPGSGLEMQQRMNLPCPHHPFSANMKDRADAEGT
jgi:hypothetical protein